MKGGDKLTDRSKGSCCFRHQATNITSATKRLNSASNIVSNFGLPASVCRIQEKFRRPPEGS